MPYKRIGSTVYVNRGGHWEKKGSSSSPEKAKRYLRALYAHEPKNDMKTQRKPGDLLMAFKAKVAKHEAQEAKTGKPAKRLSLGSGHGAAHHAAKAAHHAAKAAHHAAKAAHHAAKAGKMPKTFHGKSTKLGKGGRFAKVEAEAKAHGAKNPAAVAAKVGRAKYGSKKMSKMAAAGRKRAAAA